MHVEVKKRFFYKVQNKDTIEDIAKLFNISIGVIKSYNNIDIVEEGDVVFFPEENYYVVKPGDTIKIIAEKLSISEEELKIKTGFNKFFIGQKIYF